MAKFKNPGNDERSLQLEVKEALRSFGFLSEITNLQAASDHSFQLSVITEEEKSRTLFLKWSGTAPVFQGWLYLELLANGFKLVPDFYRTEDSAGIFAQLSGKYWTCQPYIGSEFTYEWLNFDCSPQHCFRAGETLAAVHETGARILSKQAVPAKQATRAVDIFNRFPNQFEQAIENFTRTSHIESKRSAAIEILLQLPFDRLLSEARDLSEQLLAEEHNVNQTINHGDFHPGNLLFSNAGILALVDWEYACIGSPVYDLSYALFMFCLQPLNEQKLAESEQGHTEHFSRRKAEAFLDGYSHASSILKGMQCLNLYTEFMHLLMLDWVCAELCKAQSSNADHPGFLSLASTLAACCR